MGKKKLLKKLLSKEGTIIARIPLCIVPGRNILRPNINGEPYYYSVSEKEWDKATNNDRIKGLIKRGMLMLTIPGTGAMVQSNHYSIPLDSTIGRILYISKKGYLVVSTDKDTYRKYNNFDGYKAGMISVGNSECKKDDKDIVIHHFRDLKIFAFELVNTELLDLYIKSYNTSSDDKDMINFKEENK